MIGLFKSSIKKNGLLLVNSSIYLVFGIDRYSNIPQCYKNEHDLYRVAIVFSPNDENYLLEDTIPEILKTMFAHISQAFHFDSVKIVHDGSEYSSLESFYQSTTTVSADGEIDYEIPEEIEFKISNTLLLVENTEFWAFIGGPYPYSDSFTFSFYSTNNNNEKFESIYSHVAQKFSLITHPVIAVKEESSRGKESWLSNIWRVFCKWKTDL